MSLSFSLRTVMSSVLKLHCPARHRLPFSHPVPTLAQLAMTIVKCIACVSDPAEISYAQIPFQPSLIACCL